jgi:hypothetical protein
MATRGTAWLLRRSTDLVPYLVAMAVREWWAGHRRAPSAALTRPGSTRPASTPPDSGRPDSARPAVTRAAAKTARILAREWRENAE